MALDTPPAISALQPGQVVESPILPERVEIVKVTRLGAMTQLHGTGLTTRQAIERYLNPEQLATLKLLGGGKPDYRGSPLKFRLGIEAIRLAPDFG